MISSVVFVRLMKTPISSTWAHACTWQNVKGHYCVPDIHERQPRVCVITLVQRCVAAPASTSLIMHLPPGWGKRTQASRRQILPASGLCGRGDTTCGRGAHACIGCVGVAVHCICTCPPYGCMLTASSHACAHVLLHRAFLSLAYLVPYARLTSTVRIYAVCALLPTRVCVNGILQCRLGQPLLALAAHDANAHGEQDGHLHVESKTRRSQGGGQRPIGYTRYCSARG